MKSVFIQDFFPPWCTRARLYTWSTVIDSSKITIDCYDLTYWLFSNAWQADCSIKVFWSSKSFVSNKVGVLLLNIHQFINLLWVHLLWLRITMQSYFFAYRTPYPHHCCLSNWLLLAYKLMAGFPTWKCKVSIS